VSQSVRSITSSLLAKLHQKNNEFSVVPLNRLRSLENSEDSQWGGARLRMMLQCIYTIAFLCLLRFDEVLRIELKDIEVIDKFKGHIKLILPFRKTHQYGGMSHLSFFTSPEIKPFHLFFNRKELHLDPVHHLLRWIHVSHLTTGPLFRRIDSYDRVVQSGNKGLVSPL
jgi:integrase